MSFFITPQKALFFSKGDPDDPRFGDMVSVQAPTTSPAILVAGYPDDEGINNNKGRPGAKDAPDAIRRFLYRMTPDAFVEKSYRLHDIGNVSLAEPLEQRQDLLAQHIATHLKSGHSWIGLGGGHDYGFADGDGFLQAFGNENPLVINFDAHLDVRPLRERVNSGTPFYRLLEKHKGFDFLEIGIQPQCNSRTHMKWLTERGGKILSLEDIHLTKNPIQAMIDFIEPYARTHRKVFLSLDMDVFSAAVAPGCSQSWPIGLSEVDFLHVLQYLLKKLDVRLFGVYEVSPPLDLADKTSKLAAQLIHRYISWR